MAMKDNFGNPQGLIGSLMLTGMNIGHSPMAKWGFSQFTVPENGEIADIGCGGGFNVKRLLERAKEGHVYGVDISEVSVEKTKKTNKKEIGRRCRVFQGSAEKLLFEGDSLDLVTAFETVYFWKNIEDCFQEVLRVLKTGGQFVVINDPGDPNKHWEDMIPGMTSYKPDEVAELMNKAGFREIKITKNKNMFCVIGNK